MAVFRWWLLPLALAVVVDGLLVTRLETSAGMSVNRAIVRGATGGACMTSTVVRSSAADSPTDQLFVTDTWMQHETVLTLGASPQFGPDGVLVPQSQATIAQGLDIESQPAQPLPKAIVRSGRPPLVENYLLQVHHGAAWVTGPCVPFANPMRSHLSSLGAMQTPAGSYTVYRGQLTTPGGSAELAKAEVWLGVRSDGRIGFEVLQQLPSANADPAIVFVAKLFTYHGPQLSGLAKESASDRIAFYDADYRAVLQTIAGAQELGTPPRGVPPISVTTPGPAGAVTPSGNSPLRATEPSVPGSAGGPARRPSGAARVGDGAASPAAGAASRG